MRGLTSTVCVCVCNQTPLLEQTQDRELFSEEDSSLYFTYSGGCNKLEVNNLNYEVAASSPLY